MEEYDPQIMREFMNELQKTGKVSKEVADKIAASGSTTEKYLQNLNKATQSASKDILSSAKNLAFGLVEGQRKFQDLNPVIDGLTSAVTALSDAIPLVGGVISGVAKVTAEAGKVMLRQMDIQTKAFTDVGDIGGLAAEGMESLKDQFLESGLTLDSYARALRDSSTTLARFSGTVASGAQVFSQASGILTQGVDVELRRLGFSADDLGETLEAFVGRQTRLGRSQGLTASQLANQTQAYAKELDLLSRATGLSRKAIMQQQDAALSEARFRSTIEGIQNEGVRTNLLNFQTSVNSVSAGLGQGIRDMASGFFNTEEAQALMIQTGGAAAGILGDLKAGLIDEFEARKRLQVSLRQNSESLLKDLGPAIGDASLATRNAAGVFDLINADITSSGFEIRKEQQGLAGGTNDLTNDMVQAQKNIEAMNIEMQKLFLAALPKAAGAVEGFTDTMLEAIGSISRRFLGEATEEERSKMEQFMFPKFTAPGMDLNVMQSYDKAIKDSDIKPGASTGKTAQFARLSDGKKMEGASDSNPFASILGFDAGLKLGEPKTETGSLGVPPAGPKQSYNSNSANLNKMADDVVETPTAATRTTTVDSNVQQQKITNEKMDVMIDILMKQNRIGEKQVRASYS